jgi:UDP-glucose 4-epimerase
MAPAMGLSHVHVLNLADAHVAALDDLESHPGSNETFNQGAGSGNSVQGVNNDCREVTGVQIQIEYANPREGDPPVLVLRLTRKK